MIHILKTITSTIENLLLVKVLFCKATRRRCFAFLVVMLSMICSPAFAELHFVYPDLLLVTVVQDGNIIDTYSIDNIKLKYGRWYPVPDVGAVTVYRFTEHGFVGSLYYEKEAKMVSLAVCDSTHMMVLNGTEATSYANNESLKNVFMGLMAQKGERYEK